ncbi:bifunctional diguanylate cyclase/phosphodiesterase [Pantoea sp. 18069]|uniref:putative bifunctional diguanylate cyclase/phosphodiesterase n=1 Tax=Pantoea sp. 18069 TaxID=2681415 RepID=UPI001357B9E2|nr:EAL domain-containing protein [Pantoea sp. 18069]
MTLHVPGLSKKHRIFVPGLAVFVLGASLSGWLGVALMRAPHEAAAVSAATPGAGLAPRNEDLRTAPVLAPGASTDAVVLRAAATPVRHLLPWLVILGGALVSLLLAVATVWHMRRRRYAWAQERALATARHSDQRIQALFNQAAVGVVQIDAETGAFEQVNERYASILGLPIEALQERKFSEFIHPSDRAQHFSLMQRLGRGEIQEYQFELRLIRSNAAIIWVEETASSIGRGMRGQLLNLGVVQDVTERRRLEQHHRENEERLRAVLQRLPVGLAIVNEADEIVYRNDRFVFTCGYTEQDAVTVDDWWALAYPDADLRAKACEQLRVAKMRARALDGSIVHSEYHIVCRDGTTRTVEIGGVAMDGQYLITLEDLSQRKAAEEEIRYLAFYDLLTQLPNRRLLLDRLQQALGAGARRQRSGALLMLDVDNFKTLNETRGHDQGDALLRQVATRLRETVDVTHTVGRQGGDEFVVVLEDLGEDPVQAAAVAQEVGQAILQALRQPYVLDDGEECHATVSMGATIFQGLNDTVDELLRRADLAMYQAKKAGRDTLQFFDPRMQQVVRERATLEQDLRTGLAQQQFELFYQPQVEDGRVIGAEGLLRWRHPGQGFVSPANFIPLAEESGLIVPLGEWVLNTACAQLARWSHDPAMASLVVAVNVSPRQFHQAQFVDQVLAALAINGAPPSRLKLELTEGLLLTDIDDTIDKMVQLKQHGVGFSLDDFGTGYSSLAYLKRLPLDQLKIDQSFVRDVLTDPNDAAIAKTIVALGTSLGLRVIAEGVETEAQRLFLLDHGCHAWQGYLLSPPVPVGAFETLVHAQQALSAALGPDA